MKTEKRISTSNSSFETLISTNALYVDKTKYIYSLISDYGGYYFLARPRRFGKTLTLYTLEALFQGKKELFKDLYIGTTDYDFKIYPVVHIDFANCDVNTPAELEESLLKKIFKIAKKYSISLDDSKLLKSTFQDLLENLYEKYGSVVVLIDEYDKPLSDNIYNPELEEIRKIIRGFFEVLKASPDYIRFVFITGVTKYSNMSIFSSMNNLKDISMNEEYANMFGYTGEELEKNFRENIKKGIDATGLTKKEYLKALKAKYDGYCFYPNTETVYNPISINNFFFDGGKVFGNYWTESGQSNLLTNIAKKVHFDVDSSLAEPILANTISTFDIIEMAKTNISLEAYKALLFQSGYLTITKSHNYKTLFLDYPNGEVREAFSLMLVHNVYLKSQNGIFSPSKAEIALDEGQLEKLINLIKPIFASIPYHEYKSNQNEAFYHSIFHTLLMALGATINSEIATNKGRIDTIVKTDKHIYLFEFKLNQSATDALKQIKDRGYDDQFKEWKKLGKTVHLIGISFSTEEKNITDWVEETIL